MMNIEKYLLPWEYREKYNCHTRKFLINNNGFSLFYDKIYNCWKNTDVIWHSTIEEAKNIMDKALIEDNYILIPEDKVDTYKLLL
jgi:hypothetical protein